MVVGLIMLLETGTFKLSFTETWASPSGSWGTGEEQLQ